MLFVALSSTGCPTVADLCVFVTEIMRILGGVPPRPMELSRVEPLNCWYRFSAHPVPLVLGELVPSQNAHQRVTVR